MMKPLFFLCILTCLRLAALEPVNADFAEFRNGIPAGWRETTKAIRLTPAPPDGVTIHNERTDTLDSSLEQVIENPPAAAALRFSAQVAASRSGMAYLSVKLYKNGKEIRRINSPLNRNTGVQTLAAEFNTGDSDRLSIHCRTRLADEQRGASAVFRNLRLGPSTEALPGGWLNRSNAECTAVPEGDGFRVRLDAAITGYGTIVKNAPELPKDEPQVFRGTVRSPRSGTACLTVKLIRNGKEIRRFDSLRNTAPETRLEVIFTRGDADQIELLCRPVFSPENVGAILHFTELTVVPAVEAARFLPRFELVPGFEVCSFYLNGCNASTAGEFSAKLRFRRSGDRDWQPALAPVYAPAERSARGSLLNLTECTAYDLQLEIDDRGRHEIIERQFRTRSPRVPVAQTIELGPDTRLPLVIRESGSPDGYIRYTARPGVVLDGGKLGMEAIRIDGAKYLIFDGLTIRGGRLYGLNLNHASHIQILNCDISGFGRTGTPHPDLDGKFYDADGRVINNDAGIHIFGGRDIRVERCYIHDPRGTSSSWFYSHPAGPNGIFVGEAAQVTLRYNDFIGSDAKRWNDAVEGRGNGSPFGSVYRDAEITGNYFAFGNDDGMELDGGQMNCRFLHNKTEGMLCGVSTAPCLSGPSYLLGNLFCTPGEVYGLTNYGIKNVFSVTGSGRLHFLHNTVVGDWGAVSNYGGSQAELAALKKVFKGFSRNNLFDVSGELLSPGLFKVAGDFDFDLLRSSGMARSPEYYRQQFGQEKHGIADRPEFIDAAHNNYNLRPGSPGFKAGTAIPGVTGLQPSLGAFQPDTLTDLPRRPIPFQADTARLNFMFDTVHGSQPQRVTLTVTDPAFHSEFRVIRNEAGRFFRIVPETGLLEYGKPVTLTVTIDPGQITTARRHAGAFLVRLPDGFSRAISVYADSTGDAALLARDRAKVIYGDVSPQIDGKVMLTVKIPEAGKYYMFVRTSNPPWAVSGSIDGSEFRDFGLLGAAGAGPKWVCLGNYTYRGTPNRPQEFTAGRHTIKLRQLRQLHYEITDFALTQNPETLLFAPHMQ